MGRAALLHVPLFVVQGGTGEGLPTCSARPFDWAQGERAACFPAHGERVEPLERAGQPLILPGTTSPLELSTGSSGSGAGLSVQCHQTVDGRAIFVAELIVGSLRRS